MFFLWIVLGLSIKRIRECLRVLGENENPGTAGSEEGIEERPPMPERVLVAAHSGDH